MKYSMKSILSFTLGIGIFLSGCASVSKVDERERDANTNIEKIQESARGNDYLNRGLKPFAINDGIYIDAKHQTINTANDRLGLTEKKLTLVENGYLSDFGDKITRSTGIPVRFAPDLSARKDIGTLAMSVRHKGSLAELLDSIASYYSIFWEVDESGSVVFFYLKTKTFTLATFATEATSSTKVSNQADSSSDKSSKGETSGGASGSAAQSITLKHKYDGFDDCMKTVKEMLSKDGKVTFSRGSGTITVTDSPVVLNRVEEFIHETNAKLSRQVSLNVALYTYTLRDSGDIGFNLNAVFKNAQTSLAMAGVAPTFVGGSMTATILQSPNGNWNGSSAVLSAMKERGRVGMITSGSGITMNNQPLPIQALRRTSYLASSSTTMSGDTAETTLEPGQIVSGLSILVTPHILPDNRILIEYSMSYSQLDSIAEVSSGNAMIQTPEVSSRNILQRVTVNPGSTIILAGLSQDFLSTSGSFGLFSAQAGNSDQKELLIVVIDVSDATLAESSN